ncbi:unnamed protein product [Phyllotreta striolata]|uniref:Uncharacterized protein n=1 Tax=Phyllotreta striolata TaxID=444603 RepID=A0A9N9XQG1_PHYSR|nr:unnamed protein product [Phyllotreta striolata]
MENPSRKKLKYFVKQKYTREQKIVASVWFHERHYTGMTYEQLKINFQERFKSRPPTRGLIWKWSMKLFENVSRDKKRKCSLDRLMYVPYIKESFVKFPDLTVIQRSDMLGLAINTLRRIIKLDFTTEEIELLKKKGQSSKDDKSEVNDTEDSEDTKQIELK